MKDTYTTADLNAMLTEADAQQKRARRPMSNAMLGGIVPQVSAQDAAVNRPDPVERASLFPFATYPDGSTRLALPGMIAEDIPRAFTAPSRAYRGEIPADEMISEGLNFAGNMAMTGGIAPKGASSAARVAANTSEASAPGVVIAEAGRQQPIRAYHGSLSSWDGPFDPSRSSHSVPSTFFGTQADANYFASSLGNHPSGSSIRPVDIDATGMRSVDWPSISGGGADPHLYRGGPMEDLLRKEQANGSPGVVIKNIRTDEGLPVGDYVAMLENGRGRVRSATTGDILFENGKSASAPGALVSEASRTRAAAALNGLPDAWPKLVEAYKGGGDTALSQALADELPTLGVPGAKDNVFRGYRGAIYNDKPFGQWWASSDPEVAALYAEAQRNDNNLSRLARGMNEIDTQNDRIIPSEFRFKNPLVVDANGSDWTKVQYDGRTMTTDGVMSRAREAGNDGVVIKNVVDDPGASYASGRTQDTIAAIKPGTVYSPITGDLLFENGANASAPGAIASEAARQPLPVKMEVPFYRGSANGQTAVDYNQPYWGTTDKGLASAYAKSRSGMYFRDGTTPNVTPAVARFRDPLYIDAQNAGWSDIPFEGQKWNSDKLADLAKERGHDGLVIDRLYDEGKFDEAMGLPATVAALRPGTVSSAFDPNNILYANSKSSAAPGVVMAEASKRVENPIRAYHGSPHDFDRFDMSKIGTGEGAQAENPLLVELRRLGLLGR